MRGNQDSAMQKPKEEMLQRGGGQLLLKADEIKKNKKKQKKKPASFRYGVMEVLFDLETCSLRRVVGQKPECTRNMTEISL